MDCNKNHSDLFLFFLSRIYAYPFSSSMIIHGGRDHMVVGFTTTYAISAYHH